MSAQLLSSQPRFPGPWTVRAEQAFGFEITRALGGYQSEWLCDEAGQSVCFDTAEEAQAYLIGRGLVA